ncbi:energy transducer TonB [Luteibacter sp. PPL201]|uniref:Energy transducer TonB n=1 Tax=Luteibacter sahnii TaxID=3021977 RepID=A0ABT6BFG5_9GAMM
MFPNASVAMPRRTVFAGVAGILVVASLAATLLTHTPHASIATPATGTPTDAGNASVHSGEVDILLGLARDATRDGRLVAPQGNNAYEYYLSVLQLDRANATAQDALRETLPFASQEIEQQINRRELDEARREIALLRDFDPTNYTLIILGAKLDAQQQVVTAEDEARAEAMRRRGG